MDKTSFADVAIVACGTMSLELDHLQKEGFLDTDAYTLHNAGAASGHSGTGAPAHQD